MLDIGDDTVGWLGARYLPFPMTPGELGHETRVSSGEIPAWELSIKLSRVTSQDQQLFPVWRCLYSSLLTPHIGFMTNITNIFWLYDWPNNVNDLKY